MQENKLYPKNTLFTFNMLIYLGNPKEPTDKLAGTNKTVQQGTHIQDQYILKINQAPLHWR